VVLQVPDHSFDGGSAPEFALDDDEGSASLSRDEDALRVQRIMAVNAIKLCQIPSLPNAACGTVPARNSANAR